MCFGGWWECGEREEDGYDHTGGFRKILSTPRHRDPKGHAFKPNGPAYALKLCTGEPL